MKDIHEFRFVITPFCNYRCFFCHGEGLTEECTPLLLSPQDYAFIARAGKEGLGWKTATITGGEPLVSPIYREVCELLKNEGIAVTTVTNASLVSSPKKILKDNAQINISLHTMDPKLYRKITGTTYPLSQVIDTLIMIRAQLPELEIHLNNTVIRGMTDTKENMEAIINFAHRIGAQAKFIDLASENLNLVVPIEEIEDTIVSLGFTEVERSTWQKSFQKDGDIVLTTKCGFGYQNNELGVRSLFVNPDGVISTELSSDIPINVMREIRSQDMDGLVAKIKWLLPSEN